MYAGLKLQASCRTSGSDEVQSALNGANERDTQDLKFKQDVEHAGITWNQFTVFTAHTLLLLAMHKKRVFQKVSPGYQYSDFTQHQ